MNASKKLSLVTCLLAVTGLMYGCGTEEPPPNTVASTFSGTVQQGNIANATVFLDSNNNGLFDPGEPITTTSATGAYTLTLTADQTAAVQPGAKVIVLFNANSIDTSTGAAPTGILVADAPDGIGSVSDAGTANITPFTTLLAFASPQVQVSLAAELANLGLANPDGLIGSSSPAIIALAKSVETILAATKASIATKNGVGATRVTEDVAASLAAAIASLPAGPLTPAIIASTLSNAAAATIAAETNIFVTPPTTAQITAILIPAVTTVATTVQTGAGGTLGTTPVANEESIIMTPANAAIITAAITSADNNLATSLTPLVIPVAPSVVTTTTTVTTTSLQPAISVRFNENVLNANTANIVLTNASTNAVIAGTVTYNPATFIATFTPSAPLTAGVTYTLTVSTGITNQSGTPLPASVTFTVIVAANATTGATGGSGGGSGGTGINF